MLTTLFCPPFIFNKLLPLRSETEETVSPWKCTQERCRHQNTKDRLMKSDSSLLLFGVFTPVYHHHLRLLFSLHSSCHPRSPVSLPPLLSALGRDAIFPADLLSLNDACKLLLSIAGFIYLLTNYYPWCLALCCIVCCIVCVCVCVCVCASSGCYDKAPWPPSCSASPIGLSSPPHSGWYAHLVASTAHTYAWIHTHPHTLFLAAFCCVEKSDLQVNIATNVTH